MPLLVLVLLIAWYCCNSWLHSMQTLLPVVLSDGQLRRVIGCRCAIDQQPRSLSSQQLAVLAQLAEMVVRRIERDKQILLQQHSKTALLRSLRNQQEAVLLCDTAMNGWPILFTNKSCHDMLGWEEGTLGGRGVWDVFKMNDGSKVFLSYWQYATGKVHIMRVFCVVI